MLHGGRTGTFENATAFDNADVMTAPARQLAYTWSLLREKSPVDPATVAPVYWDATMVRSMQSSHTSHKQNSPTN